MSLSRFVLVGPGWSMNDLSTAYLISFFQSPSTSNITITFRALSLQSLMDPWGSKTAETAVVREFEDNFKPAQHCDKLADSAEYIAILERKLQALRKKNKVVDNLAAYRADCLDRLMREGCDLDPVIGETDCEKLLQE